MFRGNRCVLVVFIGGTTLTGGRLGSDGDGLTGTGIPIIGAKPGIYYDKAFVMHFTIMNKVHLILFMQTKFEIFKIHQL